MEDFVNDKVDNDNEKNDHEKQENEATDSESTTFGEGKRENDEIGGKDIALFEEAEISLIQSSESLN